MQPLTIFRIGTFMAALGIVAGAFGAHAIKGRVEPKDLETFEVAVRYQMYHAIGLIAISSYFSSLTKVSRPSTIAIRCLLAGTIIFSGTLYGIVSGGPRWLGAITPIGGSLQIIGWLILSIGSKSKS